MFRALLTCVIPALFAGCATPQPYPDVAEPNSAKLRLRLEEPIVAYLHLQAIDAEKCVSMGDFGWLSGGRDSAYTTHRVDMLEQVPPREGVLQYRVEAGRPLASRIGFQVARLGLGQILFATSPLMHESIRAAQPATCAETPIFTPRRGQEYEIVYRARPGLCEMTIHHLIADGNSTKRIDITHESNQVVAQGATPNELVCRAARASEAPRASSGTQ